mmetsp:Transcript_71673/g.149568  ORF Transcript_71673/g.149568 Transcript_71673/m.149568 type:complete len:291 (+) Transcript_71673:269-1141(+)
MRRLHAFTYCSGSLSLAAREAQPPRAALQHQQQQRGGQLNVNASLRCTHGVNPRPLHRLTIGLPETSRARITVPHGRSYSQPPPRATHYASAMRPTNRAHTPQRTRRNDIHLLRIMPCGPAGPTPPILPGGPVGPKFPGRPGGPAGPAGPAGPDSPGSPMGPGGPGDPGAPSIPFFPGSPGKPGGPCGPGVGGTRVIFCESLVLYIWILRTTPSVSSRIQRFSSRICEFTSSDVFFVRRRSRSRRFASLFSCSSFFLASLGSFSSSSSSLSSAASWAPGNCMTMPWGGAG